VAGLPDRLRRPHLVGLPSIAPDEVITADTHQALWGKIKTDNGLRDWPKRTGYWVERMSGPPFWVDTSDRPGSGFRQSG
jgi:hypothetical protein